MTGLHSYASGATERPLLKAAGAAVTRTEGRIRTLVRASGLETHLYWNLANLARTNDRVL